MASNGLTVTEEPGWLFLKRGRAGTMDHDYTSHDTTTLFAALNVFDRASIAQNIHHHRHKNFIHFSIWIEYKLPKGKAIHTAFEN